MLSNTNISQYYLYESYLYIYIYMICKRIFLDNILNEPELIITQVGGW